MGPVLTELTIGDEPDAWEQAGFTVINACITIDGVTLRLQPPGADGPRGVLSWAFDGFNNDDDDDINNNGSIDNNIINNNNNGSIDGMLTLDRPRHRAAPSGAAEASGASEVASGEATSAHPNGVTGIDHVVVMTDDLDRTSAALRAFGFESRRRRAIPKSDPPRSQVFWWAGKVIIELVGPDTANGDGPASIWGLALTTPDIDTAAELLGDRMSTPRDAVQPGRRIASLRGKALDLSVPIALMTPHV